MISKDKPAIFLAPMEGVTDSAMRATFGESTPITHCVTEFIRVTEQVPPPEVFYRYVPELKSKAKTAFGQPVIVQILGGSSISMAIAAQSAVKLGANGIDINFGCPAPTVNRNDGGATLLKFPNRIFEVVKAVRDAVPTEISVSAKLRLGWDSIDDIDVNAEKAFLGGADYITIHGRTRIQGYTPPAYWKPIGRVRANSDKPVIANGEIWTLDDFKRCRDVTGCTHFMLGRGALSNPHLLTHISNELKLTSQGAELHLSPQQWQKLFLAYISYCRPFTNNENYSLRRLKQWTKMIHQRWTFPLFDSLKTQTELSDAIRIIREWG